MIDTNAKSASLGSLAVWLLICFSAAAVGAAASAGAGTFYAELIRPEWAPPASVFGPVWTALYALMAIAAWLVWRDRDLQFARLAIILFSVQLALNTLWSWLFFEWYRGALAFADILLLWAFLVATVAVFWRVRPLSGILLLPYLAWVTFAAALNYEIWQLNPSLLT